MGHRHKRHAERPRERLLTHGAATLSDAELIAVLLGTGSQQHTALDTAYVMLRQCGGLRGLLEAQPGELRAQPGVGTAKAAVIKACLELGGRYLGCRLTRGSALASSADTKRYVRARLQVHAHEVFAGLFLDAQHRVICFETLFTGTIDGTAVYPREVVKRALGHNAAALIVAHNHPSGVAEPSVADHALTERLAKALALIDVRLLDHVVVGDGEAVSFAERGLL